MASPAIIAAFEAQIGRKLALNIHYRGWKETFPLADEVDDAANGRVPVVSWNCGVPNADVISGSQDSVIDTRAAAIKAFGKPLFLRYLWDMNLPFSANGRTRCYDPKSDLPNGVLSPANFIAAWAHIRGRFAAAGVTNVVWLWNPDASRPNSLAYYPGPSQVDWVGVDAYDFTGGTFLSIFSKMYSQLAPLLKPILIAESAAKSVDQIAFLSGVVPALKVSYPFVKGFMYFDSSGPLTDWQLSPSGQAAFATLGRNAYVSAFAPFTVTSTPTPAPLLPPLGHAYFGASVNPTGTWSEAGIESFETTIRRRLAIDHHYDGWATLAAPGPAWSNENADVSFGRIPLLNINCLHHNIDVVKGTYDSEIVNIASNIKAFGKPLFINYWWEMNDMVTSNNRTRCYDSTRDGVNGGVPAGFFSPSDYVAAWRHIHAVFVAQGVTNAVWVFNFDGTGGQLPAPYYPGDAYVDWLGYDAYALSLGESFTATNDSGYFRAMNINSTKPIMVCESGVQQIDDQQAWFTGVDSTIPSRYPNIRAWLYWDAQAGNSYILGGSGLAQFGTLGATAFFNTAR